MREQNTDRGDAAMPAVTVFMPVYNAMPYLREAVESIRRQTLRDWVFVIVDDGSTDGSLEYLEGLDDPRILILRQPHQGPAVASNLALDVCKTEFFARMDADDISHPTRLEQQLAYLRGHPKVGLLGTQIETLGSMRAGRPSSLASDHRTILADLMQGRHAMCHPTVMCRTAVLREIGGYRADGVLEDWAMFLAMGQRAEVANLDRVLLSYRIHAGSTNNKHMAELRARIAFVCDRAERQQDGREPLDYDEFLALRRAAPLRRRIAWAMEGYAMTQYRRALVDILGPRRPRGFARLAWAASCSPALTLQRFARVARKRLLRREKTGGGKASSHRERTTPDDNATPAWPPKYDLFGVQVSATDYDEATDVIVEAARRRLPGVVSLHAAHAVITAAGDPSLRSAVNTFDLLGPDGQPVRWALNFLRGVGLRDRVYGPELMLRLCARAAAEGVPIYLYGGSPEAVRRLQANLLAKYPRLLVAGAESPPFRPLSDEEEEEAARRINASGAGIVFIGLGAPKQDWFAHRLRDRIHAVQVCVGAAFDFHAGNKKMAPRWMQRSGLEWFFRLCEEPGRLWRRYLVTNSVFLGKFALAMLPGRRMPPNTAARPLLEASDAVAGHPKTEGPVPKGSIATGGYS